MSAFDFEDSFFREQVFELLSAGVEFVRKAKPIVVGRGDQWEWDVATAEWACVEIVSSLMVEDAFRLGVAIDELEIILADFGGEGH